jgi:hypothetical protein
VLCKQGVTGSIPVTSTNFFLIAKDLEKSPRPERSVIRAQNFRLSQVSLRVCYFWLSSFRMDEGNPLPGEHGLC